jgi:hypothetical protein
MANQMTWGPQSRLPVQAAPVLRTHGSAAALNEGSGLDASWGWSDLWDAAKKYGPGIATTIGGML